MLRIITEEKGAEVELCQCHAERHDGINDDTSQSPETAVEAQHKLKTQKIIEKKDRPIQS